MNAKSFTVWGKVALLMSFMVVLKGWLDHQLLAGLYTAFPLVVIAAWSFTKADYLRRMKRSRLIGILSK